MAPHTHISQRVGEIESQNIYNMVPGVQFKDTNPQSDTFNNQHDISYCPQIYHLSNSRCLMQVIPGYPGVCKSLICNTYYLANSPE